MSGPRGTALQQHGLPCQPLHRQAGDVLDEGEVRLGAFQRIAEEDRQGHIAPIGQAEKGQIVVRKLESLGRPVGRAGLVSGGQSLRQALKDLAGQGGVPAMMPVRKSLCSWEKSGELKKPSSIRAMLRGVPQLAYWL